MRRVRRVCSLLLVGPVLLVAASAAHAATDIEFILDVSGSMKQLLKGEAQIDSARKALVQALGEVPSDAAVGIRAYGHRIDQAKKDESCKDSELIAPFKKPDVQAIGQTVKGLSPKGYTPIAYSLELARQDLYDVGLSRESQKVVILLTDGEETCGGDPVAVMKKLLDEGFKITVHTVGFNVNDIARKQLQEIAATTGGQYFDAKSGAELGTVLTEATKKVALVQKSHATYGQELRGGDSYEGAVPLEPGREFRLDHHQKQNDYDYFRVDLKKGQRIVAKISTQGKGVSNIAQGKVNLTENPYGGIEIHGSDRNLLRKQEIIGDRFKSVTVGATASKDGPYYILIGSVYGDTNKDEFIFTYTIDTSGDAGSDRDAGDQVEDALPVEVKRFGKNTIGDSDKKDVYSFQAKAGETLYFGIIPEGTPEGYFNLRVLDEFKQVMLSASSGSGAGVKSKDFAVADDGTYFLEIEYSAADTATYTFLIGRRTPAEGEAPTQ